MASAIHNFFIEQGSNFEITFEYLDQNGNPITINSNDCVRLKMKDNLGQYRVWRNAILDTGGSLLTNTNDSSLKINQIKLKIPSATTKTFIFSTAAYALDLVLGGNENNTIKLANGQISIIADLFISECNDGTVSSDFKTCIDCTAITSATSSPGLGSPTVPSITPGVDITPTPSLSYGTTPTPTSSAQMAQEDLCDYLCRATDIYSQVYSGSGFYIADASIIDSINTPVATSGMVSISNTGIAKNIEIYIDNLVHDNPSDLTMFLDPPSGDPILLSYRNKINNYTKASGIKFAFSNKAIPGTYLNNKSNNNDLYVNILQNTGLCLPTPYNTTYKYGFDHLFDTAGSVSGDWKLYFIDHDNQGSGYIGGWNIVVTYAPPPYNEDE